MITRFSWGVCEHENVTELWYNLYYGIQAVIILGY